MDTEVLMTTDARVKDPKLTRASRPHGEQNGAHGLITHPQQPPTRVVKQDSGEVGRVWPASE